jgi:uncharacterized protein
MMLEVMREASERAKHRDIPLKFEVITNGTLLEDAVIDCLLAYPISISVSIDGCREAHDATRRMRDGDSSYDLVIAGIQRLRKRHLEHGLKLVSVIDPANIQWMDKSYESLAKLEPDAIIFSPNFEGDWDESSCSNYEQALIALGHSYIDSYRRGQAVRLSPFDDKISIRYCGGYQEQDRCDFGREKVALAPSGNLYPCDRLVGDDRGGELSIGHISTGIDILKRDLLLIAKDAEQPECADCDLINRCAYWCGCARYTTSGAINRVGGLLCWFERQHINAALQWTDTLLAERNALFMKRFYPFEAGSSTLACCSSLDNP